MSFGFSVSDIITCSKLALSAYNALKDAPDEFQGLRLEVLSLNTTLRALAEEANSPTSIILLASPQRQESLGVLLNNCTRGLKQLELLLSKYPSLGSNQKYRFIEHVRFASNSHQGPRDKLAIHTASINIFLTSLTHSSLGRLELLIKNALRSSSQVNVGIKQVFGTTSDGANGVWSAIAQDLALEGISEQQAAQFKQEIVAYTRHLVNGGDPFWMKRIPHPSPLFGASAPLDHGAPPSSKQAPSSLFGRSSRPVAVLYGGSSNEPDKPATPQAPPTVQAPPSGHSPEPPSRKVARPKPSAPSTLR